MDKIELMNIDDWGYDDLLSAIDKRINEATEKRFEYFEFALNEKGEPDGLKNLQEMVITIAGDIADDISEKVYDKAYEKTQKALLYGDWLGNKANQLLKEKNER